MRIPAWPTLALIASVGASGCAATHTASDAHRIRQGRYILIITTEHEADIDCISAIMADTSGELPTIYFERSCVKSETVIHLTGDH